MMKSYLQNSSEEALLQRRRQCGIVKNAKRRFRFAANPTKRSEAKAMRKAIQEKLRVVALLFIQEHTVTDEVEAAGFQICADELGSIVVGHDVKKLNLQGGVEDVANTLATSTTNGISKTDDELKRRREIYGINWFTKAQVWSFWVYVWEALHDRTLIILAACAFISLIVGIATEGWPKGANDGLGIVASILLVVFVTATGDYR